jgi:hypothetical protein
MVGLADADVGNLADICGEAKVHHNRLQIEGYVAVGFDGIGL